MDQKVEKEGMLPAGEARIPESCHVIYADRPWWWRQSHPKI